MTRRWQTEGWLPRDWRVTLPNDPEWEKAARGKELGDERLNYAMNIGQVSTPGAYPAGQSVYGCDDLSGNVWEWTRSNKGDYPYSHPGKEQWRQREAEAAAAGRVLRGGAFVNGQWGVRSAVRYYDRPDSRIGRIGFRVCLSPLL